MKTESQLVKTYTFKKGELETMLGLKGKIDWIDFSNNCDDITIRTEEVIKNAK